MNPVMRICPRCRMVSYVSSMTWDLTCPHCAFHIGNWMERRTSPRSEIGYEILIRHNDMHLYGEALDYSDTGMRISYTGDPLLPGDLIYIESKKLDVSGPAEVVWLHLMEDSVVHAGIEIFGQTE
jgi:hypothetical protein